MRGQGTVNNKSSKLRQQLNREEEINKVLSELARYWQQHPELRLGQIVYHASNATGQGNDGFYMPDEKLLEILLMKNFNTNRKHN